MPRLTAKKPAGKSAAKPPDTIDDLVASLSALFRRSPTGEDCPPTGEEYTELVYVFVKMSEADRRRLLAVLKKYAYPERKVRCRS